MDWLAKFNERWHWWQRRLDVLRSTLLYLDSVFLIPHEERLPIRDHGLQIFTNTVLESQTVYLKLEDVIRQWSSDQREGRAKLAETKRLQTFVECAIVLERYEDNVEQPYLKFTSEHYAQKSDTIPNYSPLEYLKVCISDVAREEQTGKSVLRDETVRMAAVVALQKLVTPHVEILTGDALSAIISARDTALLVKLNNIIERATSSSAHWTASPTDSLVAHYRNDIFQRVKDIVLDTDNDAKMVDRLLDLKEFLDECTSPQWLDDLDKNDRKYTYATSEAFERGFACRKIKPAELIAKHIDLLMRQGQKASSDAEFFAQMKRVLTLYRFSPDKDVFRTFYTRALAKRMLLGRSASDDFEKEVLKVLSESYDAAFSDLTQMFSDLAISKDLVDDYRAVKRGQPARPDPGLSVMVLQHSVWPVIRKVGKEAKAGKATSNSVELVLPSQMQVALNDYTKFYEGRHANRKLTWAHYLGTATLTGRFPLGKKELSVSLYQAAVLLLFSERESWSVEEIEERTMLAWTDLTLTIQSLALGRKRVLKRVTARAEKDVRVRKEDIFAFNEEFTDTKHKLHINSIQQNDTVEETQQAVKVIDQYRDASLDAAIVRIMKGAKTMKNQQLVNETIEGVAKHFKPEVRAIKLRIDSLIEREFIARKDGTSDTFVYLA
ncbi:hypothetical protein M408DRAFT_14342 [Serendipita vermifera MAFF 305830]|uniref:Cullin family profile domain-containing protein n=1 Tax=Serendipita vermifera MAFF 305830 TaxID=933852 RepID=A0A0C3B719_SERVB|nr:hypothetical protein M408DRAFT_14342 [Serendipita vermifera MAFF 305830]